MPKDTNIPCTYCNFSSKWNSCVKMHIKLVHEKRKDYKCSLCDYAAGTRQALGYHTKSAHANLRDVKCEQCDYTTSHKHNLDAHVKNVHKGIKKEHECSICGHKCATNDLLRRHFDAKHNKPLDKNIQEKGGGDRTWEMMTCQICGFKSSNWSELRRHADDLDKPCAREN